MEKLTAKQLSEITGKKLWKVYYVARKLNRLPTVEELLTYKGKVGRPTNYNKEN